MRLKTGFLLAMAALLPLAPAHAAERGIVVKPAELKAKPFLDAPTSAKLAAKQQVNIVGRQGGWAQVEANGQTGWVRTLQLGLQTGAVALPAKRRPAATPASFFTGSSGKTTTTGIKGVNEEDIKNSTPDMAQVAILDSLMVNSSEATANAQQSGLQEHSIAYLKDGGKK